jgi:hypothetical protein
VTFDVPLVLGVLRPGPSPHRMPSSPSGTTCPSTGTPVGPTGRPTRRAVPASTSSAPTGTSASAAARCCRVRSATTGG